MKKITFFFLIVAATINVVSAQDTVRYPDRWYGYTQRDALWAYFGPDSGHSSNPTYSQHLWERTILSNGGYHTCAPTYSEYEGGMLRFFDPKTTPRVYGIAVTMDEVDFDTLPDVAKLGLYFGVSLHSEFPNTIYANDAFSGTATSLTVIPMANPPLMKQCVFEYDYSLPIHFSRYSNCYEFYFDQPLDINLGDSILYGLMKCGQNYSKIHIGRDTSRSQTIYRTKGGPGPEGSIGLGNFVSYCFGNYWYSLEGSPYKPYFEYEGYEDSYWGDCYWGGIFPIVSPRCTAPKDFRIMHSEERLDTVLWRGDPESDIFQVSVASYPLSPELGDIFTVSDTTFVLPHHPADTVQVAYVRKMCTFEFDTHTDTVWGDWAGPVVIVGDTTGLGGGGTGGDGGDSAGIARADMQMAVTLTPNPTSGKVTVRSAERMTTLEVFDAAGAPVLRQGAEGHATTLNTTAWPKGTYMVRITTANGVTTRKLVVQ